MMISTLIFGSLIIFFISLLGIAMNRSNILLVIISIELCLLSVNFNFLLYASLIDDILGQIFSIFILTVAAAETSIGLAILALYYRKLGSVSIDAISLLKG